jgi:hypothetical protein
MGGFREAEASAGGIKPNFIATDLRIDTDVS